MDTRPGRRGPGLDELDMFVLTHSEREYTPAAAASRAAEMAANAEKALAAAEQTALTDFVIGRLPSAIGAAWTRMQDWKLEVNRKMRSAEASSGVGVQVQVDLSADLPPLVRTVYELSCKVSDADRTDAQKAEVGTALQALLGAADGDTMLERLSAAADIRDWVDVHYLVTRPDRNTGVRVTRRWNRRTGLSGGERRLVVLAPMLAAAAAAYDRLGPARGYGSCRLTRSPPRSTNTAGKDSPATSPSSTSICCALATCGMAHPEHGTASTPTTSRQHLTALLSRSRCSYAASSR